MTDREKAIVMAYTGVCMLAENKFRIFHEYVEDIMGRPVQTIEMGMDSVADEIKEKALPDFLKLCEEDQEPCENVPDINDGNIYECPCGYGWNKSKVVRHHFCPNCGRAVDGSIKTEQEPCEDCISREAVHDMLENLPVTVEDKWFNWLQKACLRLADLPSIQPKTDVLDKIRAEIEAKCCITVGRENDGAITLHDVFEIFDKYMAEGSDKE